MKPVIQGMVRSAGLLLLRAFPSLVLIWAQCVCGQTLGLDWVRRFSPQAEGSGRTQPAKVATDPNGNVVVAGYVETANRGRDLFVVKYSNTGAALWTNVYNGPDNGDDAALDVATDRLGNVFVGGHSWGRTSGKDYLTLGFSGAGQPLWTNRYNGPNNLDDTVQSMAVDSSGNVVVTGYRLNYSSSDGSCVTIAYSNAGQPLWTNYSGNYRNSDTYPEAIAIAGDGDVVVGGSAGTGTCQGGNLVYTTSAYSRAGLPLWNAQYASNCYTFVSRGIALGANNDVIVAGSIPYLAGYLFAQVSLVSYSSSGLQRWIRNYPLASFSGIASDNSGNIYVSGYNVPMGLALGYSVSYSAAGELRWSNYESHFRPQATTVDYAANLYVSGTLVDYPGTPAFATFAYSSDGTRLWNNSYNSGTAPCFARSVAADSRGQVYVTGVSSNSTVCHCVTIAYTTNGVPLWTNHLNPEPHLRSYANAVAVGTNGMSVMVGAYSAPSGSKGYAILASSISGQPLWTNVYAAASSGDSVASAVAVGPQSQVYVTGNSWNGSNYDYATLAYSADGTPLWTNRYDGPSEGDDYATALAVDASGSVYVTGNSKENGNWRYATLGYSSAGLPLWTNRAGAGNQATAITVDRSSNVVVTGSGYLTIAYTQSGASLWTNDLELPYSTANAIASDAEGHILVTGYFWYELDGISAAYDYGTFAFSPTGGILWSNRYDGASGSLDYANSLAIDTNGNVYVTGTSMSAPNRSFNGGTFDIATVAYSKVGTALWTARFNGPANGDDTGDSVAVDLHGNVVVSGYSPSGTSNDIVLLTYSPGGVLLATNVYNGPANGDDRVSAPRNLAIGPDGGIYVAGTSDGDYSTATQYECALLKYAFGDPVLLGLPADLTTNAGASATFAVTAGGTPPFSYQWLKGGSPLSDGAAVSGAHGPSLYLSNLLGGDAGGYSVTVSNALGSVTSVVATLRVVDPLITGWPTSQWLNAGDAVELQAQATGSPALHYQWMKDGVNLPGATKAMLSLTNVGLADGGNYSVTVSNAFGATSGKVATLQINLLNVDALQSAAIGPVYAMAVQLDGGILVAGEFPTPPGPSRARIARLLADGTVDSAFQPAGDGWIGALAVQEDGNILVGGNFTFLGGQPCSSLGRLNSVGVPDSSFNPGSDGPIYSLVSEMAGRTLVGGDFNLLGGQTRSNLARLTAGGSLDLAFNPTADGRVRAAAIQSDGRIVVSGDFSALNGQPRAHLGRLNADGTLDSTFAPGADGEVNVLAVQADGKILVGGNFTWLGGHRRDHIGRLNSDGSLDLTFDPNANDAVTAMALLTDGSIIIGGSFTRIGQNGSEVNHLARLNADGTVDITFNPGANASVGCLAVQADGHVLVGGNFTTLGGQPRQFLGRLLNVGPATQSLGFDGSTVAWARGGSGPEISWARFDVATNGVDWTPLGIGSRTNGGFELSGLALAPNWRVRGRGRVVGGGDSTWWLESTSGGAAISSQPVSRTNNAGTPAFFSVSGGGDSPASYRWRKEGSPLTDGGTVSGSQTPTLWLGSVLRADEGEYSVIVSNSLGAVTSRIAALTVLDPAINGQPTFQWGELGAPNPLSVGASGTPALHYQWRKEGSNILGATESSLAARQLTESDLGNYDVVVSNQYGSLTSAVAFLAVNCATADFLDPGVDGAVTTLAAQADGRMLIGGAFTNIAGAVRPHIARLNADGTLDNTFAASANRNVYALAIQPDGKLLVAGDFTTLNGKSRVRIGRLNRDGTTDADFNSAAFGRVNALVVQPDGGIVLAGRFTQLGLVSYNRTYLGRLNPDGSVDTSTFYYGSDSEVLTLALQPDGKVLFGGSFQHFALQNCSFIGRATPDGSLDDSFHPAVDGVVSNLAVQADGKILVAGNFANLGGAPHRYLGRLNPNGSLDTSFAPEPNGPLATLSLGADGRILVGGSFTRIAGEEVNYLARLHPDGSFDYTFNPNADGPVTAAAIQPDGKTFACGQFDFLDGVQRAGIGRLNGTGSATQELVLGASATTWLRGGASPEVWRATLEVCTNGRTWVSVGNGVRSPGRWQFPPVPTAANTSYRARGFAAGGSPGSGWFAETAVQFGPQISVLGLASGQFTLSVHASPFQALVIEASTNLVNWVVLRTNLASALGEVIFSDPAAGMFPRRFYRARLFEGSLPPLAIDPGAGLQSGRFGFSLNGTPGQVVVIQTSTNLSSWSNLVTNTLGSGPLHFSDPATTNFPVRFYRAVWSAD